MKVWWRLGTAIYRWMTVRLTLVNRSHRIANVRNGSEHCVCKRFLMTWWRHQMKKKSRYWPFVWGIHPSPVNSPHKGQWSGALVFSLICAWTNNWANNLRRHRAHYDVTVMMKVTPRPNHKEINLKYRDPFVKLARHNPTRGTLSLT